MLRLNIRQTMTRIGIHTQLSTLDSHSTRPQAHTEYVAPRSNKGTTQPHLEIDTYQSRHAYGFTNHTDFARENGARGMQELKAGMSRRNQQAQAMVNNAARRGVDQVDRQAQQQLSSMISKERHIVVQGIPDAQVRCTPSEVVGEPDPGKYDWTVSVAPSAEVSFNRGKVETYVAQKGSLRQWVTEDHYDIYA